MPTYGYRCGSCGHEFEILQKITAEPLKVCPKCQGKLSKKVYAAGVIFTGSGYYTTDYKSSSKGDGEAASSNGAGSSSEHGSDSKSKAETKSDSKAESKAESTTSSKPESKSHSKTEKAS
jgi:putative FmdB family regulatory protein